MKHTASFRDAAARPPVPLQQHPGFAGALGAFGQSLEQVPLSDGGETAVLSRYFMGLGTLKMVSRGPLWRDDTNRAARRADLLTLRAAGVRIINAETHDPGLYQAAGYRQIMTPAHIATLDLTHPALQRREAMSIKWRNRLRHAEGASLRVSFRDYHDATDKWLLAADREQQRSSGYRAWPAALTRALCQQKSITAVMAQAQIDTDVCAAMLFLCHGTTASYHIGWIGKEGRSRSAHNLLLSQAADRFADRGMALMDLGVIATDAAPSLARFKLGAGAQVHQLGGTWLHLPGFWKRRLA